MNTTHERFLRCCPRCGRQFYVASERSPVPQHKVDVNGNGVPLKDILSTRIRYEWCQEKSDGIRYSKPYPY